MSIVDTFKPAANDFTLTINEETGAWAFSRITRVCKNGSVFTRQLLFGTNPGALLHAMRTVEGGILAHLPYLANLQDLKGRHNCVYLSRNGKLEIIRAGMELGHGLTA